MKKKISFQTVLVILLIAIVLASGSWWIFGRKGVSKVKTRVREEGGVNVVFDENLSKTLSFNTSNVLRVEIHQSEKNFVFSRPDESSSTWSPQVSGEQLVQLSNLLARIHFQERVNYKQDGKSKAADNRVSLKFVDGDTWEAFWTQKDIWWSSGAGKGFGTTLQEDQRLLLEASWEKLSELRPLKLCHQPMEVIAVESTKDRYSFAQYQWQTNRTIKDLNNKIGEWLSQFCEIRPDAQFEAKAVAQWKSVDRIDLKDVSKRLISLEVFQSPEDPDLYLFGVKDGADQRLVKSLRLNKAYLYLLELSKN